MRPPRDYRLVLAAGGFAVIVLTIIVLAIADAAGAHVADHRAGATSYCLRGRRMADGTYTRPGSAAHNGLRLGTRIRLVGPVTGPGGRRRYVVRDRIGYGTDLDLWAPSCGTAVAWGRRTVRYRVGWRRARSSSSSRPRLVNGGGERTAAGWDFADRVTDPAHVRTGRGAIRVRASAAVAHFAGGQFRAGVTYRVTAWAQASNDACEATTLTGTLGAGDDTVTAGDVLEGDGLFWRFAWEWTPARTTPAADVDLRLVTRRTRAITLVTIDDAGVRRLGAHR